MSEAQADLVSWHETQAVYSCDFQPLPPAQLKRLLPIGHEDDDKDKERERAVVAGGRSYRMATAGGDSKVRVSPLHPFDSLTRAHRLIAMDDSPEYTTTESISPCGCYGTRYSSSSTSSGISHYAQ